MRLSADENDPGYAAWIAIPNKYDVTVFLDGVEQRHVVTADDMEGTVYKAVPDAEGNVQVSPTNSGEIWMETVMGDVRIEVPS